MVAKLSGAAVSWISQRQPNVALSSTEAEYIASCEAAREIHWLRQLLQHLGVPQPEPTPLFVDNTSAILMMNQQGYSSRRKHIRVKYHYVQEQVAEKQIQPIWVATEEQEADVFTKPLDRDSFAKLRDLISGHLHRGPLAVKKQSTSAALKANPKTKANAQAN